MAELIFELQQRGQHYFHKLEQFPIRIGRALDNDIILSDLTVSPHHLEIDKTDDGFVIKNLSDENGTHIGKEWLDKNQTILLKHSTLKNPSALQLGHSHGRLLSSEMPVEPTRLRGCQSNFCLFDNILWSFALLALLIFVIFWQEYLSSVFDLKAWDYMSILLPGIGLILGIALVISGINRIATHRWEPAAALSLSCLIFLLPEIMPSIAHFLDYFFSSRFWESVFSYGTVLAFSVPLFLTFFLVKIHHIKLSHALGVALLVGSALLMLQVFRAVDSISEAGDFSAQPSFHNLLNANDWRLSANKDVETYIADSKTALDEGMKLEFERIESE